MLSPDSDKLKPLRFISLVQINVYQHCLKSAGFLGMLDQNLQQFVFFASFI